MLAHTDFCGTYQIFYLRSHNQVCLVGDTGPGIGVVSFVKSMEAQNRGQGRL
jgi:hypothetical protein